jgi:hypothetical protein
MGSPSPRFTVRAYSPAARAAAALLLAIAALCVLHLAAGVLLDLVAPGPEPRVPLPLLIRRLLYFAALPALASLVVRGWARAAVEVGDEVVTIAGRRASWEVPRAAVAGAAPWRVPWPSPGVAIALLSGRPFERGLAMPDPTPLVAALGGPTDHPRLVAARARRAARWLHHPLHALVLAPLVPTGIVFRLHQIIVGGDWLSEYHWYGLGRWLDSLLRIWLEMASVMLCWYALLRLAVAALSWPAAQLAEPRARAARWALEAIAAAVYYGAIAWFLWQRLGQ